MVKSCVQYLVALSLLITCFDHTFLFSQESAQADRRVDVVVFSFDRPMQLFAFLESAEKYLTGIGSMHVIYRSSSVAFENGYAEVIDSFPNAIFHKQSHESERDFKSFVLTAMQSASLYMMFAVDDLIVKDHVDLQVCTKALAEQQAWGFFLRLGKNINHCYMLDKVTPCPAGVDIGADMFSWEFSSGDGDWAYPNNTDMTIYLKEDILPFLQTDTYINPNSLEYKWQNWVVKNTKQKGICFQNSKNINVPLNVVNATSGCKQIVFTPLQLLEKFQQGLKIDITQYNQIKNSAPHADIQPTFVQRAEWQVDTVVFSYDRPLQLFAYLESAEKYLTGVHKTHVIYRSSSKNYEEGYKKVAQRFPKVIFHQQQETEESDFKSLVLAALYSSKSFCEYMMFAVDDLVVKDYTDVQVCTKALFEHKAWGFFLRLGKNIQYCYMLYRPTPCPKGEELGNNLFSWTFSQGDGDWGYPNNTDMTIYRKSDLKNCLNTEIFSNPNSMEICLQKLNNMGAKGICFSFSRNINIPINLVNLSGNRNNHSFTPQELLERFEQGLKMNISQFHQVTNVSPHVDYTPTFIAR